MTITTFTFIFGVELMKELCSAFAQGICADEMEQYLIYRLTSLESGLSWQDARLVIPVFLKRQLLDIIIYN